MIKPTQSVLQTYRLLQGGVKTIKGLAVAMNISYAAARVRYHHAKSLERQVAACPEYEEQLADLEQMGKGVPKADMRGPGNKAVLGPVAYDDRASADNLIDGLVLSIRTYNACRNCGFTKLRDVLEQPCKRLLKCKNFGRKSLYELKGEIIRHGVPRCDVYGLDYWPLFEKESLMT